ncbi:MAG: response regulator [Chloroflexota bacterium]
MRILIADDESIIRMGLKQMLTEMGHYVITATNGREAIQMARKHQPELAVLDIKMPYTDGIRVAHTLSKAKPIPIIMLTAFSDDDLIEKAAELPIQGYLVKPVKEGELKAALSVACKRFDEQKELRLNNQRLVIAIETRKLIDRAKGKLMVEKGLNEEDAYRLLQMRARDSQKSIREIAHGILNG